MSWTITGTEKTAVDQFGIQSVSLLLHGNGANGSTTIVDSSPSPKTVTAFGNAQISTAQSKFGGASIAFDGSGDYLESTALSIGTDESYTIEAWVRFNSSQGTFGPICSIGDWNTANGFALVSYAGNWALSVGTSFNLGITAYSANAWNHVAVTRANQTSNDFWLNGTKIATLNNGTLFSGTIGVGKATGPFTAMLDGYIDDFRITKGVARYTANFTPPTAPFPDI
jgi:hypothetical protein